MEKNFLAIDLGASSGRSILGTLENGTIKISELTRFDNPLIEINGHFYWDILALYESILNALKKVATEEIEISSIGIDTWGVDYFTINKNHEILGFPYSYRDLHTNGAPEKFFKLIPRKEVYEATGIQIMNFNTLFQFYTLDKKGSTMLKEADKIMFMPDGLSYLLTGKIVTEYTIASTGQILNPHTKEFDDNLLKLVGLDKSKFGNIIMPGTIIGNTSDSVCRQTFSKPTPVVAVAGHDTASAVVAVPAEDENFAYISSGTWSLMGIEVKDPIINDRTYELNFTNEGGVDGTIRFLKNICGMWLLEQCRAEWNRYYSYTDLIAESTKSEAFRSLINPDDEIFANPRSMTKAIANYCVETNQPVPSTIGEYVRCIFESLALRYKQVFDSLQELSPFEIEKLHVIGGGSQNDLLNQFTANALDIPVIAGPSEATAIGNLMMQAKALGYVKDLREIRTVIYNSVKPDIYTPADINIWKEAYTKYLNITNNKTYSHEKRYTRTESI
ncbi:MAG: rhamnulokinase [Dysgonomonas sp.]